MIFISIERIATVLFIVAFIGYILTVLKEKLYLNRNMIFIDNKKVTQKHINETDIKEFSIGNVRVRAGDEVKFILSGDKKIKGTIIGAIKRENSILLVTYDNNIKKFTVDKILKIKIISKYGRFFL